MMETWITRGKVPLFSGVFAAIANYISSSKTGGSCYPLSRRFPAWTMMLFCVVVGCILDDTLRKFKINLPSILIHLRYLHAAQHPLVSPYRWSISALS